MRTVRITSILAAFYLASAVLAHAQPPTSAAPPSTDQKRGAVTVTVEPASGAAAKGEKAVAHLAQAKAALAAVSDADLQGRAASRLAELRTRFDALERSYAPGAKKTISQSEGKYGSKVKISQAPDWSSRIGDIDRLVGELLGFPTADGHRLQVNDAAREKLQDFRKHLTAFATAANGTVSAPGKQ